MRRTQILAAATLIAGAALMPLGGAPAAAECEPTFPYGQTVFSGAAGQQAFFSMPGLCLGPTGTWTVNSISDGGVIDILADGSTGAGFTITPVDDEPRRISAQVSLQAGDLSLNYLLVAWLGLESPLKWAPAVVPSAVEVPVVDPTPGRTTATVSLPGMEFPANVECELLVRWSPRDAGWDPWSEAPNFRGEPFRVGIDDYGEPFVGVASITFTILCRPYLGFSEMHFYTVDLYVGVPIPPPPAQSPEPVLPATGGAPLLAPLTVLVPVGALFVLAGSRRRRSAV